MGPPINDERTQPDLWISPDGRWMILVVTGAPGGPGEDDLLVSEHRDGAWTTPRLLGAAGVNTPEYDYGPWGTADGRWLLFTSHRSGDADIYRVEIGSLDIQFPGRQGRGPA